MLSATFLKSPSKYDILNNARRSVVWGYLNNMLKKSKRTSIGHLVKPERSRSRGKLKSKSK